MRCLFRLLLLVIPASGAATLAAADCIDGAADVCLQVLQPPGTTGQLRYYSSLAPGAGKPTAALIAMHGHSRDANETFDAALIAVRGGEARDRTLVIAPLFQVADDRDARCRTAGVPAARPVDLLWTCASWMEGARAEGQGPGAYAVLDALIADLARQWPSLRTITVAGFSAGGQMVQHYVGFAQVPPTGIALRFVVADPGTWLYFDPERPQAAGSCPDVDHWKYGTTDLPSYLGRDAATARASYAAAEVHYLEGALDTGSARGTAYRVLDRSCAAQAQGAYRLERGLAYGAYDRARLAPGAQREVTVVPGCAHDVACVFPSEAARPALLGPP